MDLLNSNFSTSFCTGTWRQKKNDESVSSDPWRQRKNIGRAHRVSKCQRTLKANTVTNKLILMRLTPLTLCLYLVGIELIHHGRLLRRNPQVNGVSLCNSLRQFVQPKCWTELQKTAEHLLQLLCKAVEPDLSMTLVALSGERNLKHDETDW